MIKTSSNITTITNSATSTKLKIIDNNKMDRRVSTTSESSVEPMDLGRTPTPPKRKTSSTSTSSSSAATTTKTTKEFNTKLTSNMKSSSNDSDASGGGGADQIIPIVKSIKGKSNNKKLHRHRNNHHHHHHHHHYHHREKRIVQIESSDDNPHSLRKKFRISTPNRNNNHQHNNNNNLSSLLTKNNTSGIDYSNDERRQQQTETSVGNGENGISGDEDRSNVNNNESGFVDTSCHLNTISSVSAASSPESTGLQDDVKYVCPICEVVSATPHEFTNHIRCHNYSSGDTENFTCRICSKILSSASSLDRHVLVHTGERPFNCKYCHLTFTTNGNMHRHMRTHKQHQQYQRNSHNNNNSSTTPTTTTVTTNGSSGEIGGGGGGGSKNIKNLNNKNNKKIIMNSGNFSSGGGESNESDDCSTSDSNASTCSNTDKPNHNNNKNNNNNNNNMKINYNKRKSSDDDDGGGGGGGAGSGDATIKRRMKTINNNNIVNDIIVFDKNFNKNDDTQQKFCCPVCDRNDFNSMLVLGSHLDREHAEIPAKCRQCDVVFRTHKQLNIHNCKLNVQHGFKDLTFVDFSSDKFPLIAKSLCEKTARTSSGEQKFDCTKCQLAFPCITSVDIHMKDCIGRNDTGGATKLITSMPHDFSIRRHLADQDDDTDDDDDDDDAKINDKNNNSSSDLENRSRDEFFAHLDLKNKSAMTNNFSPNASEKSGLKLSDQIPTTIAAIVAQQQQHFGNQTSLNDSKDLADIQSILNVTSSTSNFLRNFENNVNAPVSECGYGKDEEEAQDAFTSEFRKMKLRGEFPCKLCTAVFPNLRALKGHNRIHISASGASGPFRCNMCPYSIHDKAALVRHMRSHNGDRPYECAVCNYAFTTKANCERHLRNRHAKTTREEVKRAIIYHPSEDSTCDDPTKKLHLFSSPEFDNDDNLSELNPAPKDRSTPVSHLKEILQNDIKPMKIQVKSLEKLIDKAVNSAECKNEFETEQQTKPDSEHDCDSSSRPIDLSMDVLDLSKKPSAVGEEKLEYNEDTTGDQQPKIDFALLQKNHQILLAQQQFLNETLPKIDSAQYFQFSQLYNNLLYPPLHPAFFLQNSFLPNGLGDFNKFAPLLNAGLFGNPSAINSTIENNQQQSQQQQQQQEQNSSAKKLDNHISSLPQQQSASMQQLLPKSGVTSSPSNSMIMGRHMTSQLPPVAAQPPTSVGTQQHQQQQQQQQQQSQSQSSLSSSAAHNSGGPVKMVIKNGVLMPKQKQRRYRTERPFACEHCSARFTLRSNMERHIKQQHPQFWAQRQRSGQHVMRGRGSSSSVMSQLSSSHGRSSSTASTNVSATNPFTAISDQVKYAILAQQLKSRKETDILQQALSQGVSNSTSGGNSFNVHSTNNGGSVMEDDDPKLIIDEDDDDDYDEDGDCEEDGCPEDQSKTELSKILEADKKSAAKKVAETILEQAIKAGSNATKKSSINDEQNAAGKNFDLKFANSMIARAETVGKYLKDVASSPFKDESPDLVSVSKLVDNATNPLSYNYFRPSDLANQLEQSDEEGLVASGSASDNNSGTEENASNANLEKKKSAYSLAPNRVSCPYCQRMFPWSSSLRRHILTHTGQKPFKCSHCPLLFTTKSNCDRHLLRKHGNVESAVSLYVPIEDIPDPIPTPKAVAEANAAAAAAAVAAALATNEENETVLNTNESNNFPQELEHSPQNQPVQQPPIPPASAQTPTPAIPVQPQIPILASSDLPFKCHLCDCSFSERLQCLDHIKMLHVQEFSLLLAKGAIDTEADLNNQMQSHHDDDERRAGDDGRGKYPDYANRKVICAFCVRRFWSTEDLRRHMRTHSGERPFQCEICLRKFTLKHSMLRHMKKHNGGLHNSHQNATNSGSDLSDDEQAPAKATVDSNHNNNYQFSLNDFNGFLRKTISTLKTSSSAAAAAAVAAAAIKTETTDPDDLTNNATTRINEETSPNLDLIGNLLGINEGILNKLLSSADEAAKFLGVEK